MTPFSSLPYLLRAQGVTTLPHANVQYKQVRVRSSLCSKPMHTPLDKQLNERSAMDCSIIKRKFRSNLATMLDQKMMSKPTKKGAVYLVGAGSGDPELLTLKAYRVMQQADVVLYDSLVSEDILDMCAVNAKKVFVGKRRNNHAMPQLDINQLLVDYAKDGHRVVRLKGGDPFIFGRGGEELQTVVQHGISFESIPGVTAASAAASSSGIPLTHRDYAQSVKFITAYKKTNLPNDDYKQMLDTTQTIVLYMGLNRLETLTQGLMDAGRSPSTPFAIVSHASLPTQQTLVGTLHSICEQQALANLPTPALLIMGDVVSLQAQLAPFNLSTPKQPQQVGNTTNTLMSLSSKPLTIDDAECLAPVE